MKNPPKSDAEAKERLLHEAAERFAGAQGRRTTVGERKALKDWLDADPRNAEAYAKVERLWKGASDLPGLRKRKSQSRKITRRDIGKVAIAALVGVGVWRYLDSHPFAEYRTGLGERRNVQMPDGTKAELGPETTISIDFTPEARRLILHDGNAYFEVAKDQKDRAFTVEAGHGRVTALGTAFGLEQRSEAVRLVVTEHAVNVRVGDHYADVSAGSAVTFRRQIGPIEQADVAADLAWRDGRLVFTSTPFGEVVAELNRWRTGKIIVLNPGLAKQPVAMMVDVSRSDTILHQLVGALNLRVLDVTPYVTLVLAAR